MSKKAPAKAGAFVNQDAIVDGIHMLDATAPALEAVAGAENDSSVWETHETQRPSLTDTML